MTCLVLVRHGQAAAGWDADLDPGLSAVGRVQADAVAAELAAAVAVQALVTSPLRRARQTAAPLAEAWGTEVRIDPALGEIACPITTFTARRDWLAEVMGGCWAQLDASPQQWRHGVLSALGDLRVDTIVFTHFIAINVAVGAALGDDRVVCFWPDNTSRTVLELSGRALRLVSLGGQADTVVQGGVAR